MGKLGSRNLIVASVVLLAIVIVAPVPQRSIGMQVFHDFGHAPVFGVIAIIALVWLREHAVVRRRTVEYVLAFAIATALGVAVEVLQIPVGRDASWLDVRSDMMGAAGLLGLFALVDRRIAHPGVRIAGLVLGCIALAAHSLPLVRATRAYIERNASFPVLFDGREHYDDYFLDYFEATGDHVPLPAPYARTVSEQALLLHLQKRWSPSLTVMEPVPDWRAYRALALDLTNPASEPLKLKLGVYDRDHQDAMPDGFVGLVILPPQRRVTIRVSITAIERADNPRPIDVSRIHLIKLFDEYAKSARDVYVSRVWLE